MLRPCTPRPQHQRPVQLQSTPAITRGLRGIAFGIGIPCRCSFVVALHWKACMRLGSRIVAVPRRKKTTVKTDTYVDLRKHVGLYTNTSIYTHVTKIQNRPAGGIFIKIKRRNSHRQMQMTVNTRVHFVCVTHHAFVCSGYNSDTSVENEVRVLEKQAASKGA